MTNPTILKPSSESMWSFRDSFVDSLIELDDEQIKARVPAEELNIVRANWRLQANDEQLRLDRDWRTWLLLGGRGSGKTWVGAGWMV